MELVAGGLPPPGKGPTFITEPGDEKGDRFEAIVLPNGMTIFPAGNSNAPWACFRGPKGSYDVLGHLRNRGAANRLPGAERAQNAAINCTEASAFERFRTIQDKDALQSSAIAFY